MLTEKKSKYARARFSGLNQRESALAAGCPERSVNPASSRLERDPDVIELLARLRSGLPARVKPAAPNRVGPQAKRPADIIQAVDPAPWIESPKPADDIPSIDRPLPHDEAGRDDPLPLTDDPIVWLRAAMNCPEVPINERAGAAKKLADLEAKKKPDAPVKVNKFRKAPLKVVSNG